VAAGHGHDRRERRWERDRRGRGRVVRDVPNEAKIASVVRTDYLIVAGTSNWGAWV
jgi:hypothetical protein